MQWVKKQHCCLPSIWLSLHSANLKHVSKWHIFRTAHNGNLKHVSKWHIFRTAQMAIWSMFQVDMFQNGTQHTHLANNACEPNLGRLQFYFGDTAVMVFSEQSVESNHDTHRVSDLVLVALWRFWPQLYGPGPLINQKNFLSQCTLLQEQYTFQIWSWSTFNFEYSLRLLMVQDNGLYGPGP